MIVLRQSVSILSVIGLVALAMACDRSSSAGVPLSPPSKAAADRGTTSPAGAVPVQVEVLKGETHAGVLELSGKALPARESILSLGVPGLIREILVQRGDRVKKDQVLLRLDRTGFKLGVQQAEAALAGANAQLSQLSTEIARVNRLLADGAAPSAALDDLKAKNEGATAQAQMAAVSLEQAKKALRDAELRAPFDAVVTDILKEVGEQAPAMPPTMLMSIADSSTLEVQVFVPDGAAGRIQVGDTARVTVDASGLAVTGEVVFVSDVISRGARTFESRIRIDNREGRIKGGAFARVRIELPERGDAVLIPVSRIRRDEDNRSYAFVAEDGVARRRFIVPGIMAGTRVVVDEGLAPGDRLIVSETAGLDDGQAVVVEGPAD